MTIEPIKIIDSISSINNVKSSGITKEEPASMFKNLFQDAVNNVIETDAVVAKDMQALAAGETDDLHTISINQTKAQLSVDLLVQLRNKVMESYSEIMRINL